MRIGGHLFHRIDSAEPLLTRQNEALTVRSLKKAFKNAQVKFASLVDVRHPYHNARTLTKQLPWHYVGMMLHAVGITSSPSLKGGERCRHKI